MRWPDPEVDGRWTRWAIVKIGMRVELRPIFTEGSGPLQRLDLVVRPPGRLAFVCPVTADPVERLYLRDGLFALARAQNLIHRSQRKPVKLVEPVSDTVDQPSLNPI